MFKQQKTILVLIICLLTSRSILARNIDVKVEPGNWWVGMKNDSITLLAKGPFEGNAAVSISSKDIKLLQYSQGDNPEYLFITIAISPDAAPNVIPIKFSDTRGNSGTFFFSLDQREEYQPTPLKAQDVIYQIIPDRFCNGQSNNDHIKGYYELKDRLNPSGVHGGDLSGLSSKLNYLREIGFTCIDLLPVYDSNLMSLSYQRDGVTDHYNIDRRLGYNKDYIQLLYECHNKGLKVAQTMVFHQVGLQHPWFKSPPLNDFFTHTEYEYKEDQNTLLSDPYVSEIDQEQMSKLWQEINMPRLNQNNRFVQDFLIQNCIWWIETAQIDILKISQIEKNSPKFLKRLFSVINNNFPGINIISDSSPNEINPEFGQHLMLESGLDSSQIHVTDYKLSSTVSDAFSTFRPVNDGMQDLYTTIAQDRRYINPMGNIIMADNHQTSRLFSNADKEVNQAVMMTGYILTMRGIPSILYGTEYLLDGTISNGKGFVRKDFPNGSWKGSNNKDNGHLSIEEEKYNMFIKRIIKWRNKNEDIFNGKLVQFTPEKGIYAYYRRSRESTAFIFINNTDNPIYIDPKKYKEVFDGYEKGYDVGKDEELNKFNNLLAKTKSITILHLTN